MRAVHPRSKLPMATSALEKIIGDPTLTTPAFVCLQERLLENCRSLRHSADAVGARALYSIKALTLPAVLPAMADILDGFAASSLYEARLARECGGEATTVHFTSPAIRPHEVPQLCEICDFVSLNSLSQLERYGEAFAPFLELGLRVNPQLSFAADPRYDPCAPRSRLGAPIGSIESLIGQDGSGKSAIRGLHCHNNCESEDFDQLFQTASRLVPILRQCHAQISWINLGGGYYFPEQGVPDGLRATADLLRGEAPYLELFLEPGTSLVQDAGVLVTTVLDIIEQSPFPLAVLDTSINHLPEVFEYQYMPVIQGAFGKGKRTYKLAGCTCLAGDVFGDYQFDDALGVGSRLCFLDVGSYSLVKANMFNGVPMPHLYLLKAGGSIDVLGEPTYETWIGHYS